MGEFIFQLFAMLGRMQWPRKSKKLPYKFVCSDHLFFVVESKDLDVLMGAWANHMSRFHGKGTKI